MLIFFFISLKVSLATRRLIFNAHGRVTSTSFVFVWECAATILKN